MSKSTQRAFTPADLPVVYRDEQLLVVNKPSGLAVHRGEARDPLFALQLARELAGRLVHPLHRLDRATSGLLVFTFDKETLAAMQQTLETGGVEKIYWALVRGIPPEAGHIDHPIPRQEGGEPVAAITDFRRLGIFERYALVEARPLTGRRHQIRKHLKHLSHPLIGDTRYGKGEHNRFFRQRAGLHRLALHAVRLRFAQPATGLPLRLIAPPPEDLRLPLESLGFDVAALLRELGDADPS
jgi:tRNA pseudouridine65 synthase